MPLSGERVVRLLLVALRRSFLVHLHDFVCGDVGDRPTGGKRPHRAESGLGGLSQLISPLLQGAG